MDEKRKFSRILFTIDAQLSCDNKVWSTHLLDLCLNGAMVEEPADFAPEGVLALSFRLPQSEVELCMEADVVHRRNGLLGLKCALIDIESISHLRRLLELNLGDASLLHRELEQFIAEHEQSR
ncbi:pilus assembly protein [Shewanella algae]|uniref:PilZ domain-containing protein n=1 Tax=Shewanella algae TaxID=38313 RepID=UPI000D14EEBB|nr:PilZ domain-containing protein [Shewanella algae]PST66172.1 pilus assembly protein [Shewanella algae]TWU68557.1 pilus assembly protein [Shewanella algae]